MKRMTGSLIAVVFVAGLIGTAGFQLLTPVECRAGELAPVIALGSTTVKLSKKAEVVIMGTGFQPGQEINLVFINGEGLKADIEHALKPIPKPDKTGSWKTTWSAGRFVDKKLVGEGAFRILVFDGDYNQLAHTVVGFEK